MSNADTRGKFVWHELLTSDTAGAGAFYPKVVSWKTQAWDRDPSYTLWMGKGGPVGGVAALEDSSSPRWLPYVAVEDVHAAVAQAKSMGAKVVKDVTDMPGTGTYAVLTDPQGAEIAVYKSANPSNSSGAAGVGEFSWHELATSDADAAVNFYSKLFGWGVGPKHDMGPDGFYHLMLHNGEQFVGIFQSSSIPVSWMSYVRVDDAGKAANAAKTAGGRVINGPMEVPGGTWIAQILDPAGAGFAVHELKAAAEAKPAAKPKAQKPAKPAAAPASEPAAAKPAARPDAPKPEAAKPSAAAKPAAEKPAASAAAAPPSAKAPAKKAAAKKAPAKKAAVKKTKAAGKKKAAKKAAKKPAKKAAGKKAAAKKAPARKKAAKKARKRR
jgi:predicted enzyme related to lactoylglutathione lyase